MNVQWQVRSPTDTPATRDAHLLQTLHVGELLPADHGNGARTVFNHADYRLLSRRAVEFLREYPEVNLLLRWFIPLLVYKSATVDYDRSVPLRWKVEVPAAQDEHSKRPPRSCWFRCA